MNTRALSLASGHDPDCVRVIYAYMLYATAWLLVGTLYGLLATMKLFWPDPDRTETSSGLTGSPKRLPVWSSTRLNAALLCDHKPSGKSLSLAL